MALKIKKLLQLFCVSKKDPKKKGKSIDPLWTASAPQSSLSVTANKSHLDPCSSGTGTVLSVQKNKPECSSMISSFARTEHGTGRDDYMLFNQFDVVQDFSDHHYAKTSPGKATKDWVKAVQSEWNLLQKNLPESVYVRVYEDRIDLLRAAIVGPAGTPYHDGLFFFDVRFPAEYPKCPPKVHYHSGGLRLNPNLYESGKVCLSLLNTWWGNGCEKWGKSNSTMLQVLVSIQGLVLNDKPYFNEPGNKNSAKTTAGEKNSLAYNQTAFVLSCKTMLYSLRKPPKKLNSAAPLKKPSLASARGVSSARGSAVKSASVKPAPPISRHDSTAQKHYVPAPPKAPAVLDVPSRIPALVPCSTFMSPGRSGDSVSVDETMSTCDSMKSPDIEYIDNGDSSMLASLQRRANEHLRISDDRDVGENKWKKNAPAPMEIDSICDVDNDFEDPQLCPTLASDIYMHLREAETKKRPSTDFMETIQKDVNPSMRAILIDWLVEVAEEYRLVPDTLYLTVNYIDRYLSGNEINRQRLQLLGVACMLIAAKYEEICAPQVEEFCYITDNTYFRDEVLEMEASVLNYLKFEMTAPTAKCFLRRFARAAQACDEDPALHLEFLANYIAELSLLEYSLLSYPPSLIAASAIFLAKFVLKPTKCPWNSTLAHYTQYKPSQLCDCVKALHRIFSVGPGSNLPAIREKYSQHKYKFVAKKQCPTSIPTEFFRDVTC